jgi:hypothetical protein
VLASGCAQTSLFKGAAKIEAATPKEPAVKLLCIWEPARGRGPNGMPTRGMAGQLMFFTRSNPSPVAVDGDVRIYLFDNAGTREEQAKPIHQFDFTPETWQAHLRDGNLGPSYHLFVPYVRGGFQQVECSLQVRFTPKEGPVVYSEMTSVVLPGNTESAEDTPESLASGKPQNARTSALDEQSAARSGQASLAVHTIRTQDLPREAAARGPAGRPITDPTIRQISATTQASSTERERLERLDRLEGMVAALLERESATAPAAPPKRSSAPHPLLGTQAAPAPAHPLAESREPAESVIDTTARRRFRLEPAAGAATHPLVTEASPPQEPTNWRAEPADESPQPLNTGTGTTYYPDWLPADAGSAHQHAPSWE